MSGEKQDKQGRHISFLRCIQKHVSCERAGCDSCEFSGLCHELFSREIPSQGRKHLYESLAGECAAVLEVLCMNLGAFRAENTLQSEKPLQENLPKEGASIGKKPKVLKKAIPDKGKGAGASPDGAGTTGKATGKPAEKAPDKKQFVPPTLEEVKEYVAQRGSCVDPLWFWDYFNCAGWVDSTGKAVQCWKQKLIAHERTAKGHGESPKASAQKGNVGEPSYDTKELNQLIYRDYM